MGLKEPYVGKIPLISGEIAEDLTYYFAKSEQTPSAVALGVLVDRDYNIKRAGGFIIQMMPDAEEETIASIEDKLKVLPPVTAMLDKGMSQEDILNELVGNLQPQILDEIPVSYYCTCSREKVERALLAVGKAELAKIIEEDHKATLHCHFCNKDYEFNEDELIQLLTNAQK
jgi:molecular chaperone Hsp33